MAQAQGPTATEAAVTPASVVASNLKRLREERGVSLSEVARRAEIHRTHVSLILRGNRMIQIDTLVKLAGALDATPDDLLDGITWAPEVEPSRGEPRLPGRFHADAEQ